ncbi:phosphatidylserine/phosphatidylglycerophosphate/cardiolipin synthase family protein [Nocardioides sp.]|uniref:phospholipase D-like domain-containing protein n=1 Tax=Nocardioides sp. TaxID=35761 RepID=UPI002725FF84|nr:phospholipase D-like domain-containing protein [Nocardioides sp.]MDO9456137.1 phospholipase D-like domain-containing protein [Nocardioides sp.]
MARLLALILLVTALAVPTTTASAAPTAAGSSVTASTTVADGDKRPWASKQGQKVKQTKTGKVGKKAYYRPKRGVTFNSAIGGRAAQRTIIDKILRTIDATPRGQEINIFSWNFLSAHGTDALLRAQARGVRVRLLMDNINNVEISNGPFRRLRAGLFAGNRGRKYARFSWARTCKQSCRGRGGQAHAKFFMFSKVGKTPRVVIQGSANLTEAATFNQWNDIYTHVANTDVWNFYKEVFQQSATDKAERRPFLSVRSGNFRLIQFPLVNGRDPVFQLLSQVKCKGARNTGNGITRIRMAPDVIRNDRGMRLAQVIKGLWNRGCDIRIGYTIVGKTIGQYLRSSSGRGPVPMRHLVQDLDEDGEFDNYFHLKAMSIIGNIGDNRNGYAVVNGSSNLSGSALRSDENIGIYAGERDARAYEKHIDYWYNRFGTASFRTTPYAALRATGRLAQPDALVFGTGKGAIYDDGTPYSVTGIDPYANLVD